MNFLSTVGGIIRGLFGTSNAKNDTINTLTQQNAMLQAQVSAQQNNAFNMSSFMPIVILMAIIMLPIMLFKK